jgi:hypothetical protein
MCWNCTSGQTLDVFYGLLEKIAGEDKNKIMAAFELKTKCFPGIAGEDEPFERQRIEDRIKNDLVLTYENVVRIFASRYPCLLTREIAVFEESLAAHRALLERHEKIKPGLALNIFSLGKFSREWNVIRTSIADSMSAAETRIGELNARRWDNRHGDSPDALAWARNKVEEVYPALAEAYRTGISGE